MPTSSEIRRSSSVWAIWRRRFRSEGIRSVLDMLKSYLASSHCDRQLLIRYADQLGNKAVFKRLGYLATAFLEGEQDIANACRTRLSAGNAKLDPKLPAARLVTAWRLWVPAGFSKKTTP